MELLVKTIEKNALEEIRIELTEYRGYDLVGMRVYSSFNSSSELMPTRKGLTVQVELLPELIDALKEAQEIVTAQNKTMALEKLTIIPPRLS